ncbi:unnamed protein product [Closterium sp. NIES-53]
MASTRVLQQQGQQQRQFQQWRPLQQWHPQQQWRPQQQLCPQQQLRPQQLWRPQQPWGPGGSGSVGCSSGPASLGACRGGRDVGPCQYRILTGRGPAVARISTALPCPAVPYGFLTGLYIPSLSRNLVGVGYLQDRGITVTFPAHGRTEICTDSSTEAVLATFTREPHSGLFFLHTPPPQVAVSGQVALSPLVAESGHVTASPPVAVSGLVAASCSCRSKAHPTVLWHHRLGHSSLPRLRSMASHSLVSGLPRVFPSLPHSLAPPCAPWGSLTTTGGRERYFLVVVDDYSRYTTMFPLAKRSEVTATLIRWLLATEGTCGSRVSCLHSDRGGEFCSGILAGFCGEQGIIQTWTLPKSPQQNGVAERRIGLVMDIACTSMIHACAPHFLRPYAVRYAAHQLNLQPRVSWPEASPTSLWTGSPSVGSVFRVLGCLALVRDTSADKISARAIPCVFLGFPVGSSNYSFYHPPLHQFLDSRNVRFHEPVSYYTRYPYRGLLVPPPPLFLAHSPPLAIAPRVHPAPPWSCPVRCVSRYPSPLGGVGAGGAAAGGIRAEGARSRGVGAGGAGTGGASSEDVGAGSGSTGGPSSGGVGAGGAGTGGAGSGGDGGGGTGAGSACTWDGGAEGADAGGSGTEETRAGGSAPPCYYTRLQDLRRLEHKEQKRLEQEKQQLRQLDRQEEQAQQQQQQPQEQQQHQHQQQPPQPLVTPSLPTYGPTFPPPDSSPAVFPPPQSQSPPPVVPHDWTARCPPRARPSSPLADLRTALFCSSPRRTPPESVLPSPPASSLTVSSHPITDYYRTACPVVSRVLASLVIDPRASPPSVSALTAAVTDFASTHRLDFAMRVVAAPPARHEAAGGDVLEDRQFELEFLAAASPSLCAKPLSPEGDTNALDIPTPRTYRTYVDAVPPPRANVVDDMWLFKGRLHEEIWLRNPPGFTDTFPPGTQWSLRRPVYGLRQSPRKWHDTLRSTLHGLGFRPSSAEPSLFVRNGSTPFFILVYVDDLVFAIADRAALAEVKSELQKIHTCTDLGELQRYLGLQITRDRAARTITLTQSHMVQQVLQRFGFQFSTTKPTPLAVDHRLTGPFPDKPFESSGPYAELVGCLVYLMTCTRPDLAFPLSVLSRFVATGRHRRVHWIAAVRVAKYLVTTSGMGLVLGGTQPVELTGHFDSSYADDAETQRSTQGYCFSLGAGAVSWRSTRSSSVASSSAEAEIYAGAMASQELRWLTFLLAELGERTCSAPTSYADTKAMILLCREPRLESRVKHIDVRYFLLRELQRRGQVHLDFVASKANIVDVFTKVLASGDHHRFCVQLGLVEVGPCLL